MSKDHEGSTNDLSALNSVWLKYCQHRTEQFISMESTIHSTGQPSDSAASTSVNPPAITDANQESLAFSHHQIIQEDLSLVQHLTSIIFDTCNSEEREIVGKQLASAVPVASALHHR